MLKSIQLTLETIHYSGDSIGRDIQIEIEVLGKIFAVDKKMKVGTTAEINQEIARFETDRAVFQTDITVAAIERDFLFNDIGRVKKNVKIDAAILKPQKSIFAVIVKENRSLLNKFWGTKSAVFEITLFAHVSDAIKYIPDLDAAQGFLKVRFENSKTKEGVLPAYGGVKIERMDAKRDYFIILEGPNRGRRASVERKKTDSSWLITGTKYEPMAVARYSISRKEFILNGEKYRTVDYPDAPWKKGRYDIEMPDHPHAGGRRYLGQSKRALTWFRIGHYGERYLHAGGRSLGCITVVEVKRWMEIYNALIKARKGDFLSVGTLEIVD